MFGIADPKGKPEQGRFQDETEGGPGVGDGNPDGAVGDPASAGKSRQRWSERRDFRFDECGEP